MVKVALRSRESLALIRPVGDVLRMHTMLWPDELRDGSHEALRVALPHIVDADGSRADYEGPDWAVLRRDCMARTASLVALQTDPDPRVAAGAGEVFKYVRQYCGKRWR